MSSEESSEESDSPPVELVDIGDIPKLQPKKIIPVNNVSGMLEKLEEISLKLEWVETLDIAVDLSKLGKVGKRETEQNVSSEDKAEHDFQRELVFYNQAKVAASEAIARLKELNIVTRRPPDYFAEMAKSDAHMTKVREKLMSKRTALERSEKARELREQKKHGKKIQHEIMQQKRSEKKHMMDALKKSKKGKMDVAKLLENKKEFDRSNNNNNNQKNQWQKKGKRPRDNFKNERYGYGGQKKRSKYNTADSAAHLPGMNKNSSSSSFSRGNKQGGRGKPRQRGARRRR